MLLTLVAVKAGPLGVTKITWAGVVEVVSGFRGSSIVNGILPLAMWKYIFCEFTPYGIV